MHKAGSRRTALGHDGPRNQEVVPPAAEGPLLMSSRSGTLLSCRNRVALCPLVPGKSVVPQSPRTRIHVRDPTTDVRETLHDYCNNLVCRLLLEKKKHQSLDPRLRG